MGENEAARSCWADFEEEKWAMNPEMQVASKS